MAMILLAHSTSTARGGQITLFNTGVDATGTPLPGGSADPHWSVVNGPGITTPAPAVVVDYAGYYATSADSNWIWLDASGSAGENDVPYTFRMTFDLSGFDPSTAVINGSWGVDNIGEIQLNGAAPVGTGALTLDDNGGVNFGQFYSFQITGGFVAGINTLDFVVINQGGPGALNVADLSGSVSGSSVPEPGGVALLVSGVFFGFAAVRRVRRRPHSA